MAAIGGGRHRRLTRVGDAGTTRSRCARRLPIGLIEGYRFIPFPGSGKHRFMLFNSLAFVFGFFPHADCVPEPRAALAAAQRALAGGCSAVLLRLVESEISYP